MVTLLWDKMIKFCVCKQQKSVDKSDVIAIVTNK